MSIIESNLELNQFLEKWGSEDGTGANHVPTLTRIAELVEKETEAYLKMDPDPFDDRHPSRARPDCTLGVILKSLFKNDEFMNKLVNNYVMHRDDTQLQTAACRLVLDILPGLETSVVFNETEGLVPKLFNWAEKAAEPLKSYATGLLAAAMEVQDIAVNFKEQNMQLVPIMLRRLKELSFAKQEDEEKQVTDRPFAHLQPINESEKSSANNSTPKQPRMSSPVMKKRRLSSPVSPGLVSPQTLHTESNSSWADLEPYMIGSIQMVPLTTEMQQRFILQYLTPMGDYQELLGHVFEENALSLILHYINLSKNHDIRLAFEALKYLASLLCHKKFALEFLNAGGLQQLLEIYRPSVAATGVSICLYYLAYNEDAMERICLLPKHVLLDLVSYALWLLECSHDSSRCHATMFFSLSFAFRIILELFDNQDGLRKLLNAMFLLDIFADDAEFTDDELFTKRQTARHVCVALKRYFEAHLIIEAEHLKRSASSSSSSSGSSVRSTSTTNIPPYKAARYSNDTILEYIGNLLELMPLRINWKPVDELMKLGGVKLMISLIAVSFDWNYTGKAETVKSVLDVLAVCSVAPRFQLALTENIQVDDDHNTVALRIILAAAEGEIVGDADVQKSALHVIINCVCGPLTRIGGTIARLCSGSAKKRSSFRSGEELLAKMWNCVRANNGIMILLNLLSIKTPISDADSVRALACKALVGLARSETVRQIIGKLPLFMSGQIQALMKEPILQDKRAEHVKFCRNSMDLMERVTGTNATIATNIEASPDSINKAEVVAQTKIIYKEKELLQLICQHLTKKGFSETASTLQKEAKLPNVLTRANPSPWPSTSLPAKMSRAISTVHGNRETAIAGPTTSSPTSSPSNHPLHSISTPSHSSQTNQISTPLSMIPIRLHRQGVPKSSSHTKNVILQKPQAGCYQPSPVMKKLSELSSIQQSTVTLDSIVTEYLRKQHALCKNPIVTCPPFDLFTPHRCPEPLNRNAAPLNMAARLQKRQVFPQVGGLYGSKFDRRFIYSRFRPVKTYRDSEGASSFTSCAFSFTDSFLFLGTANGELATFNLHTGSLEATYTCHESDITYIEPSKDGKLIITCSIWRQPISALWTFTDLFEMKLSFNEDYYVEFGKQSQDKALGTRYTAAHLYDLTTGRLASTFEDENLSNKYYKNKATFNPTDELVLNDGVLWDVRSSASVHKFDKFNQSINGVFHPNGWEIISNSEIWDIRTYHLLKTVPALDQCRIKFNQTGDVIYGAMFEEETSEDETHTRSPFGSSFRTFDATDYSNIATIDVKKNIFDLSVGPGDCFIAVVENQNNRDVLTATESVCRLYEVGRCKEEDDEEADDEEDEEENDLGDDDTDEDNLENTDDINQDESNDESDNLSAMSPISLSDDLLGSDSSSDTDLDAHPDDEDDEDDALFQLNV